MSPLFRLTFFLLCSASALGCGDDNTEGKVYDPFPAPSASFQKGMSYVVGWDSFAADEQAHRTLTDMTYTNASWVAVVPHAFQPSLTSEEITFDAREVATDGWVRQVVRWARELGLQVLLKPSLEVQDKSFRGSITPPDLDRWFGSYQAWLVALARLAHDEGVAQLCVGVELKSLAGEDQRWGALISEVRKVFSGSLTYAANWDEFDKIRFWRYVDVPGVDTYFSLSDNPHPTVADLMAGWDKWLPALKNLAGNFGGRLLITEAGLPSRAGAALQPWDWQTTGEVDLELQENYYEAMIRLLTPLDWIGGIYFWAWNADGTGGPTDNGMGINGKPAADVLHQAWSPSPQL